MVLPPQENYLLVSLGQKSPLVLEEIRWLFDLPSGFVPTVRSPHCPDTPSPSSSAPATSSQNKLRSHMNEYGIDDRMKKNQKVLRLKLKFRKNPKELNQKIFIYLIAFEVKIHLLITSAAASGS